jgi:hypothetical protein
MIASERAETCSIYVRRNEDKLVLWSMEQGQFISKDLLAVISCEDIGHNCSYLYAQPGLT